MGAEGVQSGDSGRHGCKERLFGRNAPSLALKDERKVFIFMPILLSKGFK